LLRDKPEALDPDLMIISEEFSEWDESARRIDLLGLDRQGTLVVIELKRVEDGGHMELQALRYAAMVSSMDLHFTAGLRPFLRNPMQPDKLIPRHTIAIHEHGTKQSHPFDE